MTAFWKSSGPLLSEQGPARALLSCLPWGSRSRPRAIVEAEDGACDGFLKLARPSVTGCPGSLPLGWCSRRVKVLSLTCEPRTLAPGQSSAYLASLRGSLPPPPTHTPTWVRHTGLPRKLQGGQRRGHSTSSWCPPHCITSGSARTVTHVGLPADVPYRVSRQTLTCTHERSHTGDCMFGITPWWLSCPWHRGQPLGLLREGRQCAGAWSPVPP